MKKVTFDKSDDSATDSPDDFDMETRTFKEDRGDDARFENRTYFDNIKIKGFDTVYTFPKQDTVDALPKKLNFSFLDVAVIIFSIGSFFFDTIMDIVVACIHYQNGNMWYFSLTVAFIAIPTLTMTGFSLRWYLVDADEKNLPPISYWKWTVRVIFLLLQMGPVLRYIDSLYYGLKSNKHKTGTKSKKQKIIDYQVQYYKQMIYEDADATLLRLFECFMEAAPQLVLQVYILAQPQTFKSDKNSMTEIIQSISMLTSLISMSWALASYNRALRFSLPQKLNMTWRGSTVQILWRFFDIGSRVLALGLFASVFPLYMVITCMVHYAIMVIWIRTMKTDFCENRCGECLYNMVLGVIFIFCYFNPKDSPTRRRYTFFLSSVFLENTAIMVLWYIHCPPGVPYKFPAMIAQFLSFALGVVIMIMYYVLLHPTKNISIWAHWNKNKSSNIQNGDCNTKDITLGICSTENRT